MRCTPCCGFIQLLARLVLGSAMFFIGWQAVFTTTALTADELHLLDQTPAVAIVRTGTAPAKNDAPDASAEADEAGAVQRPAVALLALDLHKGGCGGASMGIAWTIALVELIGGALLMVGLLTRFWALFMVVVLGLLFWVVSAGMFSMNPFAWLDAPLAFYTLYLQLAGMVLALGLLVSGGGRMSVDQFLFGRPAPATQPLTDED